MPPAERPRPPAKDVETLVGWISERTAAAEAARSASQGRVVMRRLNRVEYTNTLRDLLGVDVELNDLLPVDISSSGFDNSADALHVSSYLMDGYLEAADRVLNAAIAGGPQPWTINKRFDVKDEKGIKPTGSVYRHVDDGVAIFSSWVRPISKSPCGSLLRRGEASTASAFAGKRIIDGSKVTRIFCRTAQSSLLMKAVARVCESYWLEALVFNQLRARMKYNLSAAGGPTNGLGISPTFVPNASE